MRCRTILGAVLIVCVAAVGLVAADGMGAQAASIRVGAYTGSRFPADMDAYTKLVGRAPKVVEWFQSWAEPLYYPSQVQGTNNRGATPLITWSPGGVTLASLNSGRWDAYIQRQAAAAKLYGKPLMIRLAHEMNGPWSSYCPCRPGQTNAQFIQFWRHTVDLFRAAEVKNVQWVWSPNVVIPGLNQPQDGRTFEQMYPGDAYVDWVGLDGFNFGQGNLACRSLKQVFQPSYTAMGKLTTKPLMFAEWGDSERCGDKGAWIRQGFLTDVPTYLPRVRMVIAFSAPRSDGDWRVSSSLSALNAYRAVVASPAYGGR